MKNKNHEAMKDFDIHMKDTADGLLSTLDEGIEEKTVLSIEYIRDIKARFEIYENSAKILMATSRSSSLKDGKRQTRKIKNAEKLKLIDNSSFSGGIITLPKEAKQLFRVKKDSVDDSVFILSYYLSRYGHEDLFDTYVPASFCFEYLGRKLKKISGTIRGIRDIFDNLLTVEQKSHNRKGAADRLVTVKFKRLKLDFDLYTEAEMKEQVISIIAETVK